MDFRAMDLTTLAAEAFQYGYPLLTSLAAIEREGGADNTFTHQRRFDDRANANPDLLYSTARLDLSGGPLWLRVPDTGDRYHVLQFVDAWTDNFAYVGRRSTGGGEREFLLVPPGWAGREAPGAHVIRIPTMVTTLIGRFACGGPGDAPAVHALQDALRIEPMYPQVPLDGLPHPQAGVPDDLVFFETLRRAMAAFPPSPAERRYQRRFAAIGLLEPGTSPYAGAPRELRETLRDGLAAARDQLEEEATTRHAGLVNGWTNDLHLFDFNLDYFEVGTMDTPEWTMPDRDEAHAVRAVAARTGLWGNHAYESVAPTVHKDAVGVRLNGAHRYELHFPEPPPANAGWSLSMYDAPGSFPVPNPLARRAIGGGTPGLRVDADGSLTIRIQHERPDDVANWLPAPEGGFRPVLRVYEPRQAVLSGAFQPPPIVRV
ncbi:DUF1254 domain-containing protein [Dactylosporangium sp. NPDC000521]|uniref:DUF1254 domain-containing protein n=1 Tax=Dactylosporangium sp. NPDC000521 TaxID=3363975 RepID=UPI0036CEB379